MHGGASCGEAGPGAATATAGIASESSLSSLTDAEAFDAWIGAVEAPMASATLDALQYPHDAEFVRTFWSQFDSGPPEQSNDVD